MATRTLPSAIDDVAKSSTMGDRSLSIGRVMQIRISSSAAHPNRGRADAGLRIDRVYEMDREQAFPQAVRHIGADAPDVLRIAQSGDRHAILFRPVGDLSMMAFVNRLPTAAVAVEDHQRTEIGDEVWAQRFGNDSADAAVQKIRRNHADAVAVVALSDWLDQVLGGSASPRPAMNPRRRKYRRRKPSWFQLKCSFVLPPGSIAADCLRRGRHCDIPACGGMH